MKIKFTEDVELTLEQKTDSSDTTTREFYKDEVLVVEEVYPANDNSTEWIDIRFARESGWLATGVHKSLIEVVEA